MLVSRSTSIIAVLALAVLSLSSAANASVMTYITGAGATAGGLPVEAQVTFTTSANQVQITLENLGTDPKSVVQNLSGVFFTLSSGQTTGTLSSSSGLERTIASNGSFTDGSLAATTWVLGTSGSQVYLNGLGSGPDRTIIGAPAGSGAYDNANSSIAGNGPHNPFLALSATFTLNMPGVTADSTVTATTFQFGTGSDTVPSFPGPNTPEPATMSLLLVGGVAALLRRRK